MDVNNLSRSLIERVEIITGGASTVYGSDAIAGVINFITRQDFDGLSFDAAYSVTAEGDSSIYDANVTYGHNLAGGRGNVTLFAGYYERKPMFAADRELTSVAFKADWDTGELFVGGSSVIPAGIVFFPAVDLGNGPVTLSWNPDGTPSAYDPDNDSYNFAPVNYLQTPLTRYSTGLQATFSLTEHFEAYAEVGFTRNEARRNLAPVPAFGVFIVNTDNPLLTPETRQVFEQQLSVAPGLAAMFFGRRMLELGPRIYDTSRDYTRVVAGLRGEFRTGWDIDAWLSYTDASATELLLNAASSTRLAQGLLVDPLTGQCFDPTGACVPLDLFGEGRLSTEAADFIRIPLIENRTQRSQMLAGVVVTGAPFNLWSGPLEMAFGAEWRNDKGRFEADDALSSGDVSGFGGSAPIDGTEQVFELYSEAVVPIIEASANGHYLGLELGARWSNYKNAGSVWTYKAGLDWRPTKSLRFRTMYQHAVRAPNIEELFTVQTTALNFFATNDPCSASRNPAGNGNAEKCVAQGIPADQIGVFEATDGYPNFVTEGGNPELLPESSDTLTVGVVFNPPTMPGLTIALDYYDLEVTDTIGNIDALRICFDPLNTGGVFCDNIRRDQTGNITALLHPVSNRGLLATSGFDTQVQYVADLPSSMAMFDAHARISINAIWTHMLANKIQENIVTEVFDCAGYFGFPCVVDLGGGTLPVNRLSSNIKYSTGPLDIHFSWRWIEGTRNAAPFHSADLGFPDPVLAVPTVSAYSYFDLGFAYQFGHSVLARFGINNLLDKQPPQMADNVWTNNTDTGMYDVFGRSFYVSLNLYR